MNRKRKSDYKREAHDRIERLLQGKKPYDSLTCVHLTSLMAAVFDMAFEAAWEARTKENAKNERN